MSLHKLTAGDGYTYLTRQVAAQDSTELGRGGLGEYYSERGESPGRWWGRGMVGVDVADGSQVSEAQMKALFGHGHHPDADVIRAAGTAVERAEAKIEQMVRLGAPFQVFEAGATPFQLELARRYGEFNHARGVAWGDAVPFEDRAAIRTSVAEDLFTEQHGRPPRDDHELAGFVAVGSRQRTKAVAGYDLTFTPVKSVSVLWALAPPETATEVREAHDAAVSRTLTHLEDDVLFTRRGRGGVQQVGTRGALTARFTHRDSRAGDPNLHTHVALSNKVQDVSGRWLAVDGRVLHKAAVMLSEMYNSLLEAELTARLSVQFSQRTIHLEDRPKRSVRELHGIDARLLEAWSSRSAAIEVRRRQLANQFQASHYRPPTAAESIALAQQANLETRPDKHEPCSEAEQRTVWRAEAIEVLGSDTAVDAMVSRVVQNPIRPKPVSARWIDEAARSVVDRVQSDRACWQVWHLRAEAWRQVRNSAVSASDPVQVVDRVVRRATDTYCMVMPLDEALVSSVATPAVLTRADGAPVYREHGSQRYTSRAIVAAEQRLLASAQRADGRQLEPASITVNVDAPGSRLPLTTVQTQFVRALATSGRRLQVALAPAGSGKTTALAALSDAWRRSGGTVRGLAPSAVAASQLAEALNPSRTLPSVSDRPSGEVVCETLSKYAFSLSSATRLPWWVDHVDSTTLVIVDEAGMAATTDLDAVVAHVIERGGSVRLVGDDRQLAAVNAGGVLRDITAEHGAVTLTHLHRFHDPSEAAATLAVRAGDPSAIGFYADRGRIHVGSTGTVADQAFNAWVRDHEHGHSSILLTATREQVRELNQRAQRHRFATGTTSAIEGDGSDGGPGGSATLREGQHARVGDSIITRRNDRRLAYGRGDWVKNGDRWSVTSIRPDGGISVRHETHQVTTTLPRAYVTAHVDLGYATTIHGAQGITVDSSHTVLTGAEDRSLFYVAVSRGRRCNHVYLAVGGDGDPHAVVRADSLVPPTPAEVVERILARDDSAVSATTTMRDLGDPFRQLRSSALRYHDALTVATEQLLGDAVLQRLTSTADDLVPGLTDHAAWPTLRSHLALAAAQGHDPQSLLITVTRSGSFDGARDVAAILDTRLDDLLAHHSEDSGALETPAGPLPWLPAIPATARQDPRWGAYLDARHRQVADLAERVTVTAGRWTATSAPAWARPYVAARSRSEDGAEVTVELIARLAIWRAAHDVPDGDHRPTGPAALGAPGRIQAKLRREANLAHPGYQYHRRTWYRTLPESVQQDPWVTTLARRLASLERTGLDVRGSVRTALGGDEPPLPDAHPAAALWWRLVPQLGPVLADDHDGAPITPDWINEITRIVGHDRLEEVLAAPAWPALVAAVDDARHEHGWSTGQLLDLARSRSRADDGALDQMIESLVLRVSALADRSNESVARFPAGPETEPRLPRRELSHLRPVGLAPRADDSLVADVALVHRLNELAFDFYQSKYPRSWAPAYTHERLHGLSAPPGTFGYAPPGPSTLIRHMASLGVTEAQLLKAGLAKARERNGHSEVIDTFRDRLVLPIRVPNPDSGTAAGADHGQSPVAGFLGRRNPHRDDDRYAGPKYLNSPTTAAFAKSEILYGLADALPLLRAGATPILVEGAFDALAINLALRDRAVGLAPMGTALTERQSLLLRKELAGRHDALVVATDGDRAGRLAGAKAYWLLTAQDLDPQHMSLRNGDDPAAYLQRGDVHQLEAVWQNRSPLGLELLHRALLEAHDWSRPDVRRQLTQELAEIVAARPIESWHQCEELVSSWLRSEPSELFSHTLRVSIVRDADPHAWSRARLAERSTSPNDESRATTVPKWVTASATTAPRPSDAPAPSAHRRPPRR